MRNLKKVLSLSLAFVMLLGMMVVGGSAAAYNDSEDISYATAADVLSAIGVFNGDENGDFNPTDALTREQAAKIITYMLMGKTNADKLGTTSAPFTDVAADRWSAGSIAYCVSMGIIAGNGDGTFDPTATVTGYAFAKMLLVALGYDAAVESFVGNSWAINVNKTALKAKLLTGLDISLASELTREQAAQMALNTLTATMVEYDTKGTSVTINGVEIVTGASKAEPVDADLGAGEDYTTHNTGDIAETTLQFCEEHFSGLKLTTSTSDSFGRPTTTWKYGTKTVSANVVAEPVITFNTAMTEKEIFAAVGAEGIQGGDKYIVMETIYINGVVQGSANYLGNGQYDKSGSGDANETVIVAKNDLSNAAGFGNGVTVELYATATPNCYTMVAYNEYVGTIDSVTKAIPDAGVKRSVKINGVGTFVTDEFEKNDVVLYTVDKYGIASMTLASTVTGTITKATSAKVYTINGTEYTLSQNNTATNLSVSGVEGTWYLDSCGNIIKDGAGAPPASWNYGYLVDYKWSAYNAADLLGAGENVNAEKFQIITADGEKVVLEGAFNAGADGVLQDDERVADGVFEIAAKATLGTKHLVRYKLDDGEISVIEKVTDGTTGKDSATTDTITKGSAQFDGKYVTDETVVIFYNTANDKFAVYNGYKAVPATVDPDSATYFYAEKMGAMDTTTIAAIVLLDTSLPVDTSAASYVYFADATYVVEKDTNGYTIYTYGNVYLDGEKGELTFTTNPTVAAGELHTYVTNTKTGYATLGASNLAVATAITSSQSGYYVAENVYYVDGDTAYYQVDALTNEITEAAGLPGVGMPGTTVKLVYTDATAGDASKPAKVVYFTVIEA